MRDYNEIMSRENIADLVRGKVTGTYLALLMMVGADGPIVSRTEAVVTALDICGTADGLLAHLGDRATYHADVVCALLGSIALNPGS